MSPPVPLTPGLVLGGDFRIVEPLAEGGMGAVYVAEQISTGARRALKLMHRELAGSEASRRRFEQEAKASSRIESDHVVNVIAAGVDVPTGMPWLAMELLLGEDLDARVDRDDGESPAFLLEVMAPLCHAVGAAHAIGIVHRDLKPENVFLAKPRRPGDAFLLKVLDFGIAKMVAEVGATATAAIGTPMWMAPEQTVARAHIGPTADVWSLGLIAFYVLTGRRYWRAANLEEEATLAMLLREVTIDPLDAASARAAELGVAARIPAGFDAWFARCVDREPSARFADARAAFEALGRALGGASPEPKRSASSTMAADGDAFAFVPAPAAAAPPAPAKKWAFVGTQAAEEMQRALPPVAPPRRDPTPPPSSISQPLLDAAPRKSRFGAFAAVAALVVVGGGAAAGLWWKSTSAAAPIAATAITVSPAASEEHARVAQQDADEKARAAAAKAGLAFAKSVPQVAFGGIDFVPSATPGRHVVIPAFLLDKTEVTAESYAACVSAGACTAPGDGPFCNGHDPKRTKNPINCVSQAQASAFCTWVGRRLPSENEWEYAAGGAAHRVYPWGQMAFGNEVCFGRCKGNLGTCDVGSYAAGNTPEGASDLAGNVWEWTSSAFCADGQPDCDPKKKVTRGGGWCGGDTSVVMTSVRHGDDPETANANIGFRCAQPL